MSGTTCLSQGCGVAIFPWKQVLWIQHLSLFQWILMSVLSFLCKSPIFANVVVYKRGKWILSGPVWVCSSRTDKMISLPSLKGPRLHLETWSAPWSSPHWSWSGLLHLTRVAGLTWPTAWRASGAWQGSASHVGRALASSLSRLAWRRGR